MSGKPGPETLLVKKMLTAGYDEYGTDLLLVKNHGSMYSRSGVSDLTGTLLGVGVAIEVKHPKNYGGSSERALRKGPTIKQRSFVAKHLTAGGVGGFAASVEQFMEILACAASGSTQPPYLRCAGHFILEDTA